MWLTRPQAAHDDKVTIRFATALPKLERRIRKDFADSGSLPRRSETRTWDAPESRKRRDDEVTWGGRPARVESDAAALAVITTGPLTPILTDASILLEVGEGEALHDEVLLMHHLVLHKGGGVREIVGRSFMTGALDYEL